MDLAGVLSKEEVQRFVNLGLGRGVDSTSRSPWRNKSSFEVRHATFNNVIGTDEGGFIESYKSSITSNKDLQAELKASVSVPHTPVSIGLEGEMSRSSSSSRKVMGKKAVNRSVSFRVDYKDPLSKPLSSSGQAAKVPPTFEEIITAWIWKQIGEREQFKADKKHSKIEGESAITLLDTYLQGASKEENALIVDDCTNFVSSYGVTHYVSSITLGASENTVMSESEYSKLVKEGFASAKQTLTVTSKSTKSSQIIGKIIDDKVVKGSSSEAVVEIKILPIHSLIDHNHFLFLALHKALTDYAEEKMMKSSGPYVIQCADEKMYWKVEVSNSDYLLTVTKEFNQASIFHVIPSEETDDPYDFSIGWQGKTLQDIMDQDRSGATTKAPTKIMRYLELKTYFFGHSGSLNLKSHLSAKDSRLCLYNQIADDDFDSPADTTPWFEEKKVFFISSVNKKSFIAVSHDQEDHYGVKCIGSQQFHNEKNVWMLFRLLPSEHCIGDAQSRQKTRKLSVSEVSQKKMNAQLSKFL